MRWTTPQFFIPNQAPWLILLDKIGYEFECWLVTIEYGTLPSVKRCVIELEGITLLVFEEDARNVTLSEGVVVAISCQFTTIERFEIFFVVVDFHKQLISTFTLVAHLAILHGVVVANHIEVE